MSCDKDEKRVEATSLKRYKTVCMSSGSFVGKRLVYTSQID